jgi:filamentous hemagglutinin
MTQLTIITTPLNSGEGTPLANAFNYCNSNFSELYSRAQVTPPATLTGSVGDQAGMYAYDDSYFYYCFANYDGSSVIWGQVTQIANISIAAITNGDSNVTIVGPNGDATVNINGVSNVAAFRTTGAYFTGAVSTSGTVTGAIVTGTSIVGSQVTGNSVSAVGNVVAFNAFLSGGITTGTGFATTSQFDPGSFTSGVVMDYDDANNKARFSTGTGDSINFYNNGVGNTEIVVFDSAGNIFADGGFSAVGNVITQGVVSAVGNIITDGYFVGTFVGNVTGNFVVPGANTQVIFNTAGNADAVGGFTYNKDSNTMTVLGIVSSQGNVQGGNIKTAGLISATGNATGGNILTAGIVSATGNATGGNILTAGIVSATGNATGGNIRTSGQVSATGNVTGGNILTAGIVSATGNIRTNNYLIVTQDINAGGDVTATSYTGTSSSLSGNVTGGNVLTGGTISATGNINTANNISATGNITGNYILGNVAFVSGLPPTNTVQFGNSNVLIGASAGNVSINVNGISPVALFTPLGQTTAGIISATGNVVGGNLTTGGAISSTGNVTGGNISTAGLITATGNIQGENIRTAGLISATGAITGAALTGTSLTVSTGNVTAGNIVNSNANGVGNIGSSTTYFNTVFAKATSAQYADLAENYLADTDYNPGTVVVFGGAAEITVTSEYSDERVAGVISTNPAYLMNSGEPGLPVALRGKVPVRVIGPVNKGDSLVTSTTPGVATSVGRERIHGQAVFAKSLESNNSDGEKEILAVII